MNDLTNSGIDSGLDYEIYRIGVLYLNVHAMTSSKTFFLSLNKSSHANNQSHKSYEIQYKNTY